MPTILYWRWRKSAITFSGIGLSLVWALMLVPAGAARRWPVCGHSESGASNGCTEACIKPRREFCVNKAPGAVIRAGKKWYRA